MTDIRILLCFDDRILTGAGVTILSLLDAAADTTRYEINIFHPGFDDPTRAALQSLVDTTRHSMRFFEIPPSRLDGAPRGRGSWTEIVYYRLLASEVLLDRDRVIYSDVDVFICHDLAAAFATDLDGIEWAGVPLERNGPDMVMHAHFPENDKTAIFASGFMCMNLSLMRDRDVVTRYFDLIEQIGDRLVFFDLDLVNVATPEIGAMPLRYCVLEDLFESADVRQSSEFGFLGSWYSVAELEAARDDPAIIHYAGRRGKPWQRRHTAPYYRDVQNRLPAALTAFSFRNFRRKWLSRRGHRRHPSRQR